MYYIASRPNKIIVLSNNAQITYESKNGKNLSATIESKEDGKIILELPYIYYLGYNVYVNGNEVKYEESDKGFIQVELENKNSKIQVKYKGTTLDKISYFTSLLGGVLVLYLIFRKIKY